MPNVMSHRKQHWIGAHVLEGDVQVNQGRRPTGDEYRSVRRAIASRRREQQRQARIAAGTDRATLRARRAF